MVLLKDLVEQAKQRDREKRVKNRNYKVYRGPNRPNKRTYTGFHNVTCVNCSTCKKGIIFKYSYTRDDGKVVDFNSIDLEKLKQKAIDRDEAWYIENRYYAAKTANKIGVPLKELS